MDIRDLKNLMRHAYLCGFNEGYLHPRPTTEGPDSKEREELIQELVEEYQTEGHMGFNDYPCSCVDSAVVDINQAIIVL
jgi:hypothetical protein